MKKLLLLLLISTTAFGVTRYIDEIRTYSNDFISILRNEIRLGDDTTTTDKKITANNGETNEPYLFYDESANLWKKSDDGVIETGFGSTEAVASKNSDYTTTSSDNNIFVDTGSGDVTIDLHTAVGVDGQNLTIQKTAGASNKVIIDGNASETVDRQTTIDMPSIGDKIILVSDGTNWIAKSREIRVVANYTSNNGQTISTGPTVIKYEDVVEDTHSMYNTGTGLITFAEDGDYEICALATYVNISPSNTFQIELRVDTGGGLTTYLNRIMFHGSSTTSDSPFFCTIVAVDASDTAEVRGVATSADPLSTTTAQNRLTIRKVKDK